MMQERYSARDLETVLLKKKVATLEELMEALGTTGRRTVFRKLKEASCLTSYTHRGRYYTSRDIPKFDDAGLWFCRSVGFSIYGTLVSTAQHWVEASEAGVYAEELDNALRVGTRDVLRKLARDGRLHREKVGRQYLYCSGDPATRKQQLPARRVELSTPGLIGPLPNVEIMPDELKAALLLFFSLLDEKLRRLYAGLEALKAGHGGDRLIAGLFGLDEGTVSRGRRELLARDVQLDRVRRPGAGRKSVKKKRRK